VFVADVSHFSITFPSSSYDIRLVRKFIFPGETSGTFSLLIVIERVAAAETVVI